jgi:hypothetical protein
MWTGDPAVRQRSTAGSVQRRDGGAGDAASGALHGADRLRGGVDANLPFWEAADDATHAVVA